MTSSSNQTPFFFCRTQHASWQDQLRESVRLYLNLGADSDLSQELESLLLRTEEELLAYLLADAPPTAASRQQARQLLDHAQCALLRDQVEQRQPPQAD